MSFKIKEGERVGHALRRLGRSQLRNAREALTNEQQSRTDRVHDLRTSIKRARALIDVACPTGGRQAAQAHRELRRVAAAVAALRDGGVSLSTFDSLLPSLAGEGNSRSLRRARGHLAGRLRQAGGSFEDPHRVRDLTAGLQRARRHLRRAIPGAKGWGGRLREGLFVGYRRARRAQQRAYASNSAADFHRWRQAVKAHRYQMQLLVDLWPGEATAHVELLERLGEILGDEHDLTVLADTITADQSCLPSAADCERLFALVDARRQALRTEARPLGDRLFAERPRAFRRRIRDELRAGREHAAAGTAAPDTTAPR